jgi:hypothetical protein
MCKQASGPPLTLIVLSTLWPLGGCMNMGHRPPMIAPPPISSAPDTKTTPPQRAISLKPRKLAPRETRTAEAEPPTKVIAIDPQSLLGLDPDGVQKRLGVPGRTENSALSRKWIYAAPGCSFSIFFYPDVNSTTFHVLKYGSAKDNGESINNSDVCIRKILTARNNAN